MESTAILTGSGHEILTEKSHAHFGLASRQPMSAASHEQPGETFEDGESNAAGEDDAPEAVSNSQARAEGWAAQAEKAKASKERKQKVKDKRKRRDEQFKSQAEVSEKKKYKAKHREKDNQNYGAETNTPLEGEILPMLLPEELLALEVSSPSHTIPFGDKTISRKPSRERKSEVSKTSWPKDVILDGKNLRLLKSHNRLLPPKVNLESKSIREAWLQGRASFPRAGKRGCPTFKRRAGPQSFV